MKYRVEHIVRRDDGSLKCIKERVTEAHDGHEAVVGDAIAAVSGMWTWNNDHTHLMDPGAGTTADDVMGAFPTTCQNFWRVTPISEPVSDMVCTGCGASIEHADYWIVDDSRLCKACHNDYGETPASDMTTTEAATPFDLLRDLLDDEGCLHRNLFAIAREHLEELHAEYTLEHESRVSSDEACEALRKRLDAPDAPDAIAPKPPHRLWYTGNDGVDLDLARIAGLNGVLERIAHNLELLAGAQKRRPSYPPSPPNSGGGSTGPSPRTEEVT